VSSELWRLIDRELGLLAKLVNDHESFIAKVVAIAPDLIEREAAATVLHSFYTGVESVMRSVAILSHVTIAKSASWHSELLDATERGDGLRQPLLSTALAGTLRMYLQFRHRFRNL
jgi:hypothetical protein